MRKISILAFSIPFSILLITGCDCNKPPLPVVEDALVQIMTDGEWSITNFSEGTSSYTQEYAGWRFKFYSTPTKTVDAKLNGSLVYTGTWDGSVNTMTFTANFPAATTPVNRIIGTWNVSATGSRVVDATMTVGSVVKVMKLYRE